MKIKDIGFKNICSYGNKLHTIPLSSDNNLIVISGQNGMGKTTISNAIMYALYGKASKRKIKDLPNRINKAMHTFVSFETKDGRDVEIHRGLAPSFFDIKVNGEPYTISGKTEVNSVIEREFIGIPFDVFSNTILLSINDFKSFVKMKKEDKRKIVNKIFPIEDIDKMHEILKADLKVANEKIGQIQYAVSTQQLLLESHKQEFAELEAEAEAFDENRKNELSTLISESCARIEKYDAEIKSIQENIESTKTKYESDKAAAQKTRDAAVALLESESTKVSEKLTDVKKNAKQELKGPFENRLRIATAEYDEAISVLEKRKSEVKSALIDKTNKKKSEKKSEIRIDADEKIANITHRIKNVESDAEKQRDVLYKTEADLESVKSTILDMEHRIDVLGKRIKIFEAGQCDSCGTELTGQANIDSVFLIKSMRDELVDSENRLLNMRDRKSELVTDIKGKKDALSAITDDIERMKREVESINSNCVTDTARIDTDMDVLYNEKISELDRLTNEKKSAAGDIFSDKKELIKNDFMNAVEKHISIEASRTEAALSEITKKTRELDKALSDKKDSLYESYNTSSSKQNQSLSDTKYKRQQAVDEKSGYSDELDKLNESSSKQETLDLKRSQVNEDRLKLDELEMERLKYESLVGKYERTRELFMDDGLKRSILGKFLPVFNSKISELTSQLGYEFEFVFNEDFDPVVTHMGDDISTDTLSSGEEKMMDIIVILAMIEIIKYRNPDMNMMFLDEIYNTLDMDNIKKVTLILRKYTEQYGMTIFLISHTPVPMEYFDKQINVSKQGYFSELEIK